MCYINGLRVSLETFIRYKQQQKELKQYNLAGLNRPAHKGFDYGDWPVIKPSPDGKDWDVVAMEWGYLPGYLKNAEAVNRFRFGYKDVNGKFIPPYTTLNAKGEELLLPNKMYREAALEKRCLVLSSGFIEHQHVFGKNKRTGAPLKNATKYPYHITIPGKEVFMMLGIYNTWTDQDTGETKDTVAIVTTQANELMAQIHNSKLRMPTIPTEELADRWTDPDLTEEEITTIATFQFPAKLMAAHTLKKTFFEELDPTEAFVYPDLPPLIIAT